MVSKNRESRQPANLNSDQIDLESFDRKSFWSAELGADLVSLISPADKRVMSVSREEVARHIRFARDLRHGRTVAFTPLEGMKPYTFRIDGHNLRKLLHWLPQKDPREVRKEVRLHAIVIILFGLLFLIRHHDLGLAWAAALMGMGVAGLIWAKRTVYFFNGVLMFLFGVAQIVPETLHTSISAFMHSSDYLPSVAAAVFLCWGVQQFSMLGLNAQVRDARTSAEKERVHRASPLVRQIGRIALIASGLLWAYDVGLIINRWGDLIPQGGATLLELVQHCPDIAIFAALAAFFLAAGAVLVRRRRLMYPDAKVVAHVLIAGFVFVVWGFCATFNPADPWSFFSPMLTAGGVLVIKPYVWISLLPAVVAFNRWYAKAQDRELEEILT